MGKGFKLLYGQDLLFPWTGVGSDLMYPAHKAAVGMMSVYRQIGVGCEILFSTNHETSCKSASLS